LGLPEAIAAGDQRREAARMKAEREAWEIAELERREREAEAAKMAEEERQRYEQKRKDQEEYDLRRIGFFEQLHNLICGISVVGNNAQIAQLDVYVANREWERFSQQYHQKKTETLRTLQVAVQNLPILIEKLEKM
jgi:hypothetical protein